MNQSQWQIRPKFIFGLFILFGILYAVSLSLPPLSGKLKGNQFASFACRYYLRDAKAFSTNQTKFEFDKMSEEKKSCLTRWGPRLALLTKTNFVWQTNTQSNAKELVIVCSKMFDNVPEPSVFNLWRRNPAYAVGYSDGTTGLISPLQFTNLNLTGFISLSNLASNSAGHKDGLTNSPTAH